MAGRFCQSCRCEPVTAGPPTCFCFGSLVRKNQNDSPPPPAPLQGSRGKSTASKAGSAPDWASAGFAAGRGTSAGSRGGSCAS